MNTKSPGIDLETEYFPTKFHPKKHDFDLTMVKLPRHVFLEPFFNAGVHNYMQSNPDLGKKCLSINELSTANLNSSSIPPTGFIFHMSRCGSTLASQMMAALNRFIVLAEPDVLSRYLIHINHNPTAFDASHFRALVQSYGKMLNGEEKYYFIKFSSWNILLLEKIRCSFPEVPWLFLGRKPVEVLVSNLNNPSAPLRFFRENPVFARLIGKPWAEVREMKSVLLFANYLKHYLEVVNTHLSKGRGIFLEYPDIIHHFPQILVDHFGIQLTHHDLETMRNRSLYNSKGNSHSLFTSDTDVKNRHATKEMHRVIEELVLPHWNQLLPKKYVPGTRSVQRIN